jgi:hypothetical protein
VPATDEELWRAWAVWLGCTLITFAVLENTALRRNRAHTLTATTRRALGLVPSRPWGRLTGAGFAAGCAVLASHVTLGKP